MQFQTRAGKTFEKPNTGMYHAVLADIVDLGELPTSYKGITKIKPFTRFVWVLNVNGTDGKPLLVTRRYNNNMYETSDLYKAVKQILNAAPPLNLDSETLIGSVRKLFIQREVTGTGTEQTDYANILGISPADPGVTVAVPSDFVRDKNKKPEEQAKNKKRDVRNTVVNNSLPVQTQPATQPTAADPQAQIAELQRQLQAAQQRATQGADIKF